MADQMSHFVRAIRRHLKITQEELAQQLGITVGTVNRWENGRFRPSKLARTLLLEFARKHNLSPERLLADEPSSKPTPSVN